MTDYGCRPKFQLGYLSVKRPLNSDISLTQQIICCTWKYTMHRCPRPDVLRLGIPIRHPSSGFCAVEFRTLPRGTDTEIDTDTNTHDRVFTTPRFDQRNAMSTRDSIFQKPTEKITNTPAHKFARYALLVVSRRNVTVAPGHGKICGWRTKTIGGSRRGQKRRAPIDDCCRS